MARIANEVMTSSRSDCSARTTTRRNEMSEYLLLQTILSLRLPSKRRGKAARELLDRFGSAGAALNAEPEHLSEVTADNEIHMLFDIVKNAAKALTLQQIDNRDLLNSQKDIIEYCRLVIGYESIEYLIGLYLNSRNRLIAHERLAQGTINHTSVYPREIIRRALHFNATAVILVHNHPCGDPKPSQSDISVTREIVARARDMAIEVHDHIIIGRNGHFSLRQNGHL